MGHMAVSRLGPGAPPSHWLGLQWCHYLEAIVPLSPLWAPMLAWMPCRCHLGASPSSYVFLHILLVLDSPSFLVTEVLDASKRRLQRETCHQRWRQGRGTDCAESVGKAETQGQSGSGKRPCWAKPQAWSKEMTRARPMPGMGGNANRRGEKGSCSAVFCICGLIRGNYLHNQAKSSCDEKTAKPSFHGDEKASRWREWLWASLQCESGHTGCISDAVCSQNQSVDSDFGKSAGSEDCSKSRLMALLSEPRQCPPQSHWSLF